MKQIKVEREGTCKECSSGPMKLDEEDKIPVHHWPLFRNRHCEGSGTPAFHPMNSKMTRGKRAQQHHAL